MYKVKPLGINIRQNDKEVKDGFLQESINLQWRDGSYKPIPNRILTDINTTLYGKIILHKVGDEDQINVLGFSRSSYGYLAEDLSAYLGGGEDTLNGDLTWFGTIIDGEYTAKETAVVLPVVRTAGMSWTILNGLMYFMGNGSSVTERYYTRLQYNDSSSAYESKDMYAWKNLIPFYPEQVNIKMSAPKDTWNILSQCGFVLTRFSLVLKTGEEVLHSPIYFNYLFGVNKSDSQFTAETVIKNIHTVINLNLEFIDNSILGEEISAINVYSSIPNYVNKIPAEELGGVIIPNFRVMYLIDRGSLKGEIQKNAEQPFYLVKTIEKPTSEQLILSVGSLESDIEFEYNSDLTEVEYSKVDILTIAAGQSMPVDNYSYHQKYGTLTSYNGRLIIERPTTVLSDGHIRSLALNGVQSYSSFKMDTEDGKISKLSSILDKSVQIDIQTVGSLVVTSYTLRGILSYPDLRADTVGLNGAISEGDNYLLNNFKCRKNKMHNMACNFEFYYAGTPTMAFTEDSDNYSFVSNYMGDIIYVKQDSNDTESPDGIVSLDNYLSDNAVQFSSIGEYSVWPAENNYRIGDGKIMKVGANNVDQKSANMVSMLIVGTTDGVYSINTDPTGNNLVSSITRIARIPYLSSEVLQVEDVLFFVSDKGLMAISGNNKPQSLSYEFFPGQGDGLLQPGENVLPNYLALTDSYFDGSNIYNLSDIVNYLKRAKLAYDSRRNSIWCSNPYEEFSLIYDIGNKCWGMSTTVFAEAVECFGTITSNTVDYYSWYLAVDNNSLQPYLMILSGEDLDSEVFIHLLTRPIKFNGVEKVDADDFKKIQRMMARCELYRSVSETGYFTFGLWGKQDLNKLKENIPIIALSDGSDGAFPDNIRQNIPINSRKGKYKSVSLLLGGQVLPDSSIDSFDFEAALVDKTFMR